MAHLKQQFKDALTSIGMGLGSVLALIGVTGSIGVYHHELDAALNPRFWQVTDTAERATPGAIAVAVRQQIPTLKSALL